MMKKIIYLISLFFLFAAGSVYAQKDRIEYLPNFDKRTLHFGYYLGMNSFNYKIDYKSPGSYNPIPPLDKELSVDMENAYGFNIGFVVDLRLHDNINLRLEPGLMSNSLTFNFLNPNIGPENPDYGGTTNTERTVTGTYLHIPLLFKFSTNRLNNIRPYILGGASYDYNFSSNEDNSLDNYDSQFRTTTHNFMYEVGLGMEFYFYFFKFSPSIRGIFAINDQLVRDSKPESPWTGPIDSFGVKGIYLNLTFE
jgi:hypothetical protein